MKIEGRRLEGAVSRHQLVLHKQLPVFRVVAVAVAVAVSWTVGLIGLSGLLFFLLYACGSSR